MSKEAQPECPRDENTRDAMQRIGAAVDEHLPQGWGFVILAFPFGEDAGRLNYVSNGTREDVIKMMKEFIEKSENPDSFGKHI